MVDGAERRRRVTACGSRCTGSRRGVSPLRIIYFSVRFRRPPYSSKKRHAHPQPHTRTAAVRVAIQSKIMPKSGVFRTESGKHMPVGQSHCTGHARTYYVRSEKYENHTVRYSSQLSRLSLDTHCRSQSPNSERSDALSRMNRGLTTAVRYPAHLSTRTVELSRLIPNGAMYYLESRGW